jgi:mono/diheme cytochrome c family protein
MKASVALLGLLAASAIGPQVHAQAADTQSGRRLAERFCAACHSIEPREARSPNARAPGFWELAMTPGMTSMALSVAFTTPHAGMPMFQLTSEQAADIIAYILGLRAEHGSLGTEGSRLDRYSPANPGPDCQPSNL